jgi:transglutaminase-like putative cysteine protease
MSFLRQSLRSISGVTLFFFVWLTLQPLQAAAQAPQRQTPVAAEASEEAQYGQTLADMEEILQGIVPEAMQPPGAKAPPPAPRPGLDVAGKTKRLRTLHGRIKNLEAGVEQSFLEVEAHLKEHHLPAELLTRHQEAVQAFHSRKAEFARLMQAVERADDTGKANLPAALNDLGRFLTQYPSRKRHTPLDPKKLPFATSNGKVRAPKETQEELKPITHPPKPVQVAATELIPGLLAQADISTLSSTPTPEDLAQTEDVQITQAIRDLAESLHKNPVEIHNWVKNHIEFLPTYGSIQGSDLTLQTLRGNAFDTASLLLALLRASNIPARYAYGTIQLPIDQAMNWVGGVTSPEAALDLLGQGGIPSIGVTSGGKITSVRLEHVWVEAYVDYIPSRGARNKQGDTWIPLDGSFKQYSEIPSLIPSDITADIENVIANYMQLANRAPDDAWSTGFDANLFTGPIQTIQAKIDTILAANPDQFTLESVIGGRRISESAPPILAGSLPYAVIASATRFTVLPESLRVSAQIELHTVGPYGDEGGSLLSKKISLAALGYASVNLTHVPATAQDAAIWDSYTNAGAQEFPAYLVHVKSRLIINGAPVAESGDIGIGQDLGLTVSFSGAGQTNTATFRILSGDEMEIGINGAGQSPLAGLSLKDRSDLGTAAGNLFAASKVFWTQQDFQDQLMARLHGVVVARLPSVGIFAAPISVNYFFGIPRQASYHSRQVDVKLARIAAVALDGNRQVTTTFVMNSGMMGSSTEGATVEEVFSKPVGHGSNTMRLLQLANEQKIPIFRLTASNIADNRAALQHPYEVMADIDNALNAGMEVIIPQTQQSNGAWTGSGYIMLDPSTGSADYRVSGGLSGNFDNEECQRSTQPIKMALPDVAMIWSVMFAWMIDDNMDIDGAAIAYVLSQVFLVARIVRTLAYVKTAVTATGNIVKKSFEGILVGLIGMEVAEAASDSCD